LITNAIVDRQTAIEMNKIFFEVVIAPDYDLDAIEILSQKKNRIILILKNAKMRSQQVRSLLNGVLMQDKDMHTEWPRTSMLLPKNRRQKLKSKI